MWLLFLMLLTVQVQADDEAVWHQECHVIDGQRQCAGHLEGCIKFCN